MKTLTQSAQAAKAIKQELKTAFPGVQFSVKSDNYSMGDSVGISWTDGPLSKAVEEITDKYQYGHFNGMEDIYEYSNDRNDIPQAKYVKVNRKRSEETELLIIEQLKKDFDPDFSMDKHYGYGWGSQVVWQRFTEMDLTTKPEITEKATTKIKVLVDIEGGSVRFIAANTEIEVIIVDHDLAATGVNPVSNYYPDNIMDDLHEIYSATHLDEKEIREEVKRLKF